MSNHHPRSREPHTKSDPRSSAVWLTGMGLASALVTALIVAGAGVAPAEDTGPVLTSADGTSNR